MNELTHLISSLKTSLFFLSSDILSNQWCMELNCPIKYRSNGYALMVSYFFLLAQVISSEKSNPFRVDGDYISLTTELSARQGYNSFIAILFINFKDRFYEHMWAFVYTCVCGEHSLRTWNKEITITPSCAPPPLHWPILFSQDCILEAQ